jgi:predicted transport protein
MVNPVAISPVSGMPRFVIAGKSDATKIVEVSIKNRSEISYVLTLIKQSYEKN